MRLSIAAGFKNNIYNAALHCIAANTPLAYAGLAFRMAYLSLFSPINQLPNFHLSLPNEKMFAAFSLLLLFDKYLLCLWFKI